MVIDERPKGGYVDKSPPSFPIDERENLLVYLSQRKKIAKLSNDESIVINNQHRDSSKCRK